MREEEREGLLTVCYDTKNRYISKEEFVVGVDAVNEILQEFCEVFFDNKISIETRILVPEHGSFIQNIGFFVMGALLTAPIGEFSTGFMTELLGKSPQERSGFTSLDQSTAKLRWTVSLVMPPI